jgi:hypothetical protein
VSRDTQRAACAAIFLSVWDETANPVAWPNKTFETPNKVMFAVFNIVDRGSTRMGLSRSFFKRHHATLQIDIYTPQDEGTKPSRLKAEMLEDLFQDLELLTSDGELLRFGTPFAHTLAPNEIRAVNVDDNWDRYVFEAPFYRDQHVEK